MSASSMLYKYLNLSSSNAALKFLRQQLIQHCLSRKAFRRGLFNVRCESKDGQDSSLRGTLNKLYEYELHLSHARDNSAPYNAWRLLTVEKLDRFYRNSTPKVRSTLQFSDIMEDFKSRMNDFGLRIRSTARVALKES